MKQVIFAISFSAMLFLAFGAPSCQAQQPVPQHGVKIAWNADTDTAVDQYQVSRGTVSGGPYATVVCTVQAPLTTCEDSTVTGVVTGKYFYVVQAHDPISGWSPISNEVSPTGTVPSTTPAPIGASAVIN